jgi:hypothetical protein
MNHEQLVGFDYRSLDEMIVNKMKIIVLIFAMFVLSFCAKEGTTELGTFEWILGEWISDDGKNITKEFWYKVSPNTYEGEGLTLSKSTKDTINCETLRIVAMSSEIFYLAKVSHNEFPVPFKMTSHTVSSFVFENKTHDFPKRIEYKRVNKNQINVTVGDDHKGFKIKFNRKRK